MSWNLLYRGSGNAKKVGQVHFLFASARVVCVDNYTRWAKGAIVHGLKLLFSRSDLRLRGFSEVEHGSLGHLVELSSLDSPLVGIIHCACNHIALV
jgi:hypothetical protein